MTAGTDTGNSKCWSVKRTEFQPLHPSVSLLSVQPCWYLLGTGSQVFKVSKILISLVKNGCWGHFIPTLLSQHLRGVEDHASTCWMPSAEGRDGMGWDGIAWDGMEMRAPAPAGCRTSARCNPPGQSHPPRTLGCSRMSSSPDPASTEHTYTAGRENRRR